MNAADRTRGRPTLPGRAITLLALMAGVALPAAVAPLHGQERTPSAPLPLEMTRSLGFTIDEGTWMSADVSPDGRTLVFDILGDLYTLPIEGGEATRITSGPGFDAMPRFSPDGRQIVFVSDRSGASNVWVSAADGTGARALTRTEWFVYVSPTFTPDGGAVVVSRNDQYRGLGTYDLWLHPLEGGAGRRLVGDDAPGGRGGGSRLGPRFDAHGQLWYSTSGAGAQLHRLDPATGMARQVTSHPGGAMRPLPSPTQPVVVYGSRRGTGAAFRVRNLETGDEHWLTDRAQQPQTSNVPSRDLMPAMAFLPDGSAFVTSHGGKLRRIDMATGEEAVIPFTATVDQQMGPSTQFEYPLDDSTLVVRHIRTPRLSPDGRQVAFVALDRIWVAELPGAAPGSRHTVANARRLTTLDEVEASPAWTPDGTRIAFVTWNDSTGGNLRDAPSRGGNVRTLVPGGFFEKLVYTPDGSRLVFAHTSNATRFEHDESSFTSPSNTDADLAWIPASGGVPQHIRRLEYLNGFFPPYYGVPHFGPDPARILVWLPEEDGLHSMRLDGTDMRLEMRTRQRSWYIQGQDPGIDVVLSPTGRHAALLGMQNIFVTRVQEGAPPPTISLTGDGTGPFRTRRVSRIGGDFPTWSADGGTLAYTLGSTLFLYDVEAGGEPARVDMELRLPRDRPEGVLALTGARIITQRGDEVLPAGDLVVRGNRIAAIGPTGTVDIPADAERIDLAGATILPGFVDTHAHLGAIGWGVHRTEAWQFHVNLAYGVTSARDPQTQLTDALDYADRIEIGDMLGPRLFGTGRGVLDNETIRSYEEMEAILRRYSDFFRTGTIKQYLVGDRIRRQWFIQAARELGLTPTSEGGGDALMNLTLVQDGYAGLEHNLPIRPLHDDVVQLLARSGVTHTPALTVAYGGASVQEYFASRFDYRAEPRLQRFWPADFMERRASGGQWRPDEAYDFIGFAADAARVLRAGGRVAVGSHGNLQGIGFHLEMWGLALGGMTPAEVLRAATLVGAEAIGHGADLGSLEVGKLADLQVLDADPLADIRNSISVRMVMKNGRLYEAATLDEVWPRRRALPTGQWWMSPERR